jgi:hypothetical protein
LIRPGERRGGPNPPPQRLTGRGEGVGVQLCRKRWEIEMELKIGDIRLEIQIGDRS